MWAVLMGKYDIEFKHIFTYPKQIPHNSDLRQMLSL